MPTTVRAEAAAAMAKWKLSASFQSSASGRSFDSCSNTGTKAAATFPSPTRRRKILGSLKAAT